MKKRILIIGIILIVLIAIFVLGIKKEDYYNACFNTLYFHTPMELEYVKYADVEYLGAPIVFDEEDELKQWEDGFLTQLNSTSYQRGTCYFMSSMDGVIITFKFKGYDETLKIVFKEPNDVRMLDFGWITKDALELPFPRELAEELFYDKYPEIYLKQFK